jgi:hypothetical protein
MFHSICTMLKRSSHLDCFFLIFSSPLLFPSQACTKSLYCTFVHSKFYCFSNTKVLYINPGTSCLTLLHPGTVCRIVCFFGGDFAASSPESREAPGCVCVFVRVCVCVCVCVYQEPFAVSYACSEVISPRQLQNSVGHLHI